MTQSKEPQTASSTLRESLKNGPVPVPTSETAEFWQACSQQEMVMPFCNLCERFYFYPRGHCRYCQTDNVSWQPVSGKGTVESYVINHLPFPEFETKIPQVIAVIALDEGVNFLSQLVIDDPDPADIPLGMPVEVMFIERGEISLPFFISTKKDGGDNA